jgi:hypothetical protein
MRRILILALLAFAVAPVAASVAAGGPNAVTNASASCTALKSKVGPTTFAQAFTSFGSCVSAMASVEQQNIAAAQTSCTAEQSDAAFAASHGGKTFVQFYGTGKNGKDAFTKCLSAKAQAASKAEQLARTNPSRTCRTLQTTMTTAVFAQTFGKSANDRNAHGKCVSATARAQVQNETSASVACRAEQTANLTAFAATYSSNSDAFGKCVSTKASAKSQAQQQATVAAGKMCTTERNAGVAAFNAKYGTFKHCVALLAKTP